MCDREPATPLSRFLPHKKNSLEFETCVNYEYLQEYLLFLNLFIWVLPYQMKNGLFSKENISQVVICFPCLARQISRNPSIDFIFIF